MRMFMFTPGPTVHPSVVSRIRLFDYPPGVGFRQQADGAVEIRQGEIILKYLFLYTASFRDNKASYFRYFALLMLCSSKVLLKYVVPSGAER
jgi:hypothetical protein